MSICCNMLVWACSCTFCFVCMSHSSGFNDFSVSIWTSPSWFCVSNQLCWSQQTFGRPFFFVKAIFLFLTNAELSHQMITALLSNLLVVTDCPIFIAFASGECLVEKRWAIHGFWQNSWNCDDAHETAFVQLNNQKSTILTCHIWSTSIMPANPFRFNMKLPLSWNCFRVNRVDKVITKWSMLVLCHAGHIGNAFQHSGFMICPLFQHGMTSSAVPNLFSIFWVHNRRGKHFKKILPQVDRQQSSNNRNIQKLPATENWAPVGCWRNQLTPIWVKKKHPNTSETQAKPRSLRCHFPNLLICSILFKPGVQRTWVIFFAMSLVCPKSHQMRCTALKVTCLLNCLQMKIVSSECTKTMCDIWKRFGSRCIGAMLSLLRWTTLQLQESACQLWTCHDLQHNDSSGCTKQNKTSSSCMQRLGRCSCSFMQVLFWQHPQWCARCSSEQPSSPAVSNMAGDADERHLGERVPDVWVTHADTLCMSHLGHCKWQQPSVQVLVQESFWAIILGQQKNCFETTQFPCGVSPKAKSSWQLLQHLLWIVPSVPRSMWLSVQAVSLGPWHQWTHANWPFHGASLGQTCCKPLWSMQHTAVVPGHMKQGQVCHGPAEENCCYKFHTGLLSNPLWPSNWLATLPTTSRTSKQPPAFGSFWMLPVMHRTQPGKDPPFIIKNVPMPLIRGCCLGEAWLFSKLKCKLYYCAQLLWPSITSCTSQSIRWLLWRIHDWESYLLKASFRWS